MLVGLVLIVVILSMQFNGVIDKPWWLIVVSCVFIFLSGMLISGVVRFKVIKEVGDGKH